MDLIRRTVNIMLAALWILLAAAYSAPLWLPQIMSIDFALMIDPSAPDWLLPVILVVACAVPPFLLAAFTWWWLRGRKPA